MLWITLVAAALVTADNDSSYAKYVNPLIGTSGKGHAFSGATIPFGMAKPGADSAGTENQAGFNSDEAEVFGFSQMHDDGTGGGSSLGVFPIMPMDCKDGELSNCMFKRDNRTAAYSDPKASPNYFKMDLPMSKVELTATRRTAVHKYTFNSNSTASILNLEITDLSQSRDCGWVKVDDDKNQLTGKGTFSPSFGKGQYDMYFCANFDEFKDHQLYYYDSIGHGDYINITDNGQYEIPPPAGVLMKFDKNEVNLNIGVSHISADQACSNIKEEVGNDDFDTVHQKGVDIWDDYLNIMHIKTDNDTDKELFYTSLYRAAISPQNVTGENSRWESDSPTYDSFYCLWDGFRTSMPFYAIVAPQAQLEMVQSMLDFQQHEGWLFDCYCSQSLSWTQGGSSADNVIADLYVKGVGKDQLDWDALYKAIVKDAEEEPPDWDVMGRGGLQSWKDLHYIPAEDFDILGSGLHTRSASRTIEYAYNDFCISQVAKGMGDKKGCKKYLERSHNWKNLWNNETEFLGFKGFIQPKYLNGTWGEVNVAHCSPGFEFGQCYLNPDGGEFYEASPYTYSMLMSHDYASFIDLVGEDQVWPRLDAFFHKDLQDVGDEPGWINTFIGHYAHNTSIAADRMREFIPHQFNNTLAGLPDNDDSGAMSSFVVFNMIGLYPNTGQDVYFITSPFFTEIQIGKATVKAPNYSLKNRYIQSAKLNGKEYKKAYVTHSFFTGENTLELEMGDTPSNWGDPPPSVSDGGYNCD